VIQVSRILHASYLFKSAETKILFDPLFESPFSVSCHSFPRVEFDRSAIKDLNVDAVFISHYHDDHCSFESLNLLKRETPIYIYCVHEEMLALIRELGFQSVTALDLNLSVRVGDFEVIPRRAVDTDVDSIFEIHASGLKILNVVDSWIDEDTLAKLANRGPWDLVLWPFQTMLELDVLTPSKALSPSRSVPQEWLDQLRVLAPRYVVPSSCQFSFEEGSWLNTRYFPITYRKFIEDVEASLSDRATKVVRMDPASSWELGEALRPLNALDWIKRVDTADTAIEMDYEFQFDRPVPSSNEVAKRFAGLTAKDRQAALGYCRSGLIERFKTLGAPLDPFFQKPRAWVLRLFDNDGSETRFVYRLESGDIELRSVAVAEATHDEDLSHTLDGVAWVTELPLVKLYGALFEGESLTSMYVRINDVEFAPEVEDELRDVHVLNDPLLRCLFNDQFASYQRAQLERLVRAGALRDPSSGDPS
jgi:L-ascorbate metabolism protein UlaG (beta-lactamase superfamily)